MVLPLMMRTSALERCKYCPAHGAASCMSETLSTPSPRNAITVAGADAEGERLVS